MRFFLAAAVCITFIGGLSFYMNQRAAAMQETSSGAVSQAVRAQARFILEITPTFTVEPDPFAIQLDDAEAPPALLVRLGQKDILRETERLEAGSPIRIDPFDGLVIGENELYVEANPPAGISPQSHALRIRLFKNDQTETEQTFWSEPGGKAAGVFRFTLRAEEKEDGHGAH